MFNLAPVPVPDLSARVVLVTGAGKGIGAELVRILVANGARVYAGVFAGEAAEALPDAATVLTLDVTKQADVEAAIARITAESGRLDVLVNNAGMITPIGPLADLASDALAPAFGVNVIGVHRMAIAALPLLRASKGVIVNAGTGAATTPMEGWTVYCATKAGDADADPDDGDGIGAGCQNLLRWHPAHRHRHAGRNPRRLVSTRSARSRKTNWCARRFRHR